MSNNIYTGWRSPDGATVEVNGAPLDLRLDLANHSPTGFEWGYAGSGPTQLALAILANEYDDDFALLHYHRFRDAFLVGMSEINDWALDSGVIEEWASTL